jgi:T-complex protein 1 subunit gamma
VLNEIDRNLADAMSVARNVVFNPTLVPGGGAVEMAISVGLHARARAVTGVEGGPYRAVADALEVIPRTLVQNAGGNAIRALTALRVRFSFRVDLNFSDVFLSFAELWAPYDPQAKHASGEHSWGIDGETGEIVDMKTYKLYESASVKVSTSLSSLAIAPHLT